MPAPAQQQMTAKQQNAAARALILSQATPMRQIISSQVYANPAQGPITIPVRPVGLVKGFFIEVVATITNNSTTTAVTPSDAGPMNLVDQFTFVDLNNYTRIQTKGRHVAMLNQTKLKQPWMTALLKSATDNASNMGSNWVLWNATASIADAGGTGTYKIVYYLPLAYSDHDLRGAIYAGVINATMQITMQFNQFPGVTASTNDSTNACCIGSTLATISSATVTVTQDYLDQLPAAQNGYPILPILDTNTVYELKNTTLTGMVNNSDFAIPYSNYRDYLSVFLEYNDGTTANGGRPTQGQGVTPNTNYLALQTANFVNVLKNSEYLQAGLYRNIVGTDCLPGLYYFSSRLKPISTTQTGNQQLILNPANLGSAQPPYVNAFFEDFGLITALTQAGSIASS